MSTYQEFYKGRDFDIAGQRLEVPFVVTGVTNEASCYSYVVSQSAAFRSGLYRQNISANHEGNGIWKGSISYGQFKRDVGSWRLSFDTSGGTLHIEHSKFGIRNAYGTNPPYAAGDKGPIGEHDGQVDGCDIVIPALKLTFTYRHSIGAISMAQIKNLARHTGKTNSATWMTFEPNELLLLGCTGGMGTDTESEVTYTIAASQNATGLTIGAAGDTVAAISSVAKKGHDYLDVRWVSDVKTSGGVVRPMKAAQFVYTHKVYDEVDFASALGFS